MTNYNIVDDVFPESVLDKIDKFWRQASLKVGQREMFLDLESPPMLMVQPTITNLISDFEADVYLKSHLKKFNSNASFRHLERFYINVGLKNNKYQGHSDIDKSDLKEEEFYIVALIFLNPKCNGDSGIFIDKDYIEDKYNRLIVFNGFDWHKVVPPKDNFVRLTLYCNFSNRKNSSGPKTRNFINSKTNKFMQTNTYGREQDEK